MEAAALLFNFHFRRPKASENPGIITSLKPTTSLPLEVCACETTTFWETLIFQGLCGYVSC